MPRIGGRAHGPAGWSDAPCGVGWSCAPLALAVVTAGSGAAPWPRNFRQSWRDRWLTRRRAAARGGAGPGAGGRLTVRPMPRAGFGSGACLRANGTSRSPRSVTVPPARASPSRMDVLEQATCSWRRSRSLSRPSTSLPTHPVRGRGDFGDRSRDKSKQRFAPDVPALLAGQPSVTITQHGGPGSPASVSIRGSAPHEVLVLLDGVPLNDPTTGDVDLASLPLEQIERVTILRGAAAARYGARAFAGVIAIERRHPTVTAGCAHARGRSVGRTYRTRGRFSAVRQSGGSAHLRGSLSGGLTRFAGRLRLRGPPGAGRRTGPVGPMATGVTTRCWAQCGWAARARSPSSGPTISMSTAASPAPSSNRRSALARRNVDSAPGCPRDERLVRWNFAATWTRANGRYAMSTPRRRPLLLMTIPSGSASSRRRWSWAAPSALSGSHSARKVVGSVSARHRSPRTPLRRSACSAAGSAPALSRGAGRLRPSASLGARIDHDDHSDDTRWSPSVGVGLSIPGATVQASWAMAFAPPSARGSVLPTGCVGPAQPRSATRTGTQ